MVRVHAETQAVLWANVHRGVAPSGKCAIALSMWITVFQASRQMRQG